MGSRHGVTGYSTREVAELLGMNPARIRAFARAGFLAAQPGPRRAYRFRFEDVVLLRAAKELADAHIDARKIWRALRLLKSELPRGQSLATLRIAAEGDAIVVRGRDAAWHPDSGQLTFDFAVADLAGKVAPLARSAARTAAKAGNVSSNDWYELGLELEAVTAGPDARQAYEKATALDDNNTDAHINLGRLLHEEGYPERAEVHYRKALVLAPGNATAAFNLGTALQDLQRAEEAIDAYEQAVAADPDFADAHYNLSQLYERFQDRTAALRHLSRYKNLTR